MQSLAEELVHSSKFEEYKQQMLSQSITATRTETLTPFIHTGVFKSLNVDYDVMSEIIKGYNFPLKKIRKKITFFVKTVYCIYNQLRKES